MTRNSVCLIIYDHWLLVHDINQVHKNKSELQHHHSLFPNLHKLFSYYNNTRPNRHRYQTSIRNSTKAYWKNYTNQFCKICNWQLLQAHQLHKQNKTKPPAIPPTPPRLNWFNIIDNRNFNLTKPNQILPEATKASPTAGRLLQAMEGYLWLCMAM